MGKKSFGKNTIFYIVSTIFLKGSSALLIPFYAYFLSTDQYGKLGIYNSVFQIFSLLIGLNLSSFIARKFHENMGLSWYTSIISFQSLLVISVISFIIGTELLFHIPISEEFYFGIIVAGLYVIFNSRLSYLQAAEEGKKYAFLSTMRGVGVLIITVLLFTLINEEKHRGRYFAEVIVFGSSFLILLISQFSKGGFRINLKDIKEGVKFSLPLIPHNLGNVILTSADKFIIADLLTISSTGVYTFSYQIALVLQILSVTLLKSWTPMFFRNRAQNRLGEITEITKIIIAISIMVATCMILFSDEVVSMIASKDYMMAKKIVPFVVMGYFFWLLYSFHVIFILEKKRTYIAGIITLIAALFNVGLNYLFIPKFGVVAAAITTCASYILLFLIHYLNVRFVLKEKSIIPTKQLIIIILIVSSVLMFSFLLSTFAYVGVGIIIAIKLMIVFLILAYCMKYSNLVNKLTILFRKKANENSSSL